MTKLNVGRLSRAQEAEVMQALEDAAIAVEGQEVIEENGVKYIVSQSQGLTVKTRIS